MDGASLALEADGVCRVLGYAGKSTYYDAARAFDRRENAHAVATAFGAIGIHSVFGLSDGAVPGSFKPVVYVGVARDAGAADELHRRVWTQGVVPLLIVVTPSGVEVRSAVAPPAARAPGTPVAGLRGRGAPALEDVSARALATSVFWKDRTVSREHAVDGRLVGAIEALNRYACKRYPEFDDRDGRAVVNALVGRLIYLYVLIDRGVVGESWLRAAILKAGCADAGFAGAAASRGVRTVHPDFDAAEVWAALDAVDDAINGCVFPIGWKDRSRIPSELVRFVHRVVRWGEEVAGRQLSFLEVTFEILRTETISAIYERFLRVEDGEAQRAEGAFYTPPYLADFVVARADGQQPFDGRSRVVDASAGSGVFLVSAYRRIMERCVPLGGWGPRHAGEARRLLKDCIFGIEKNPQAANVCRFSLYLTMLDYLAGVDIERLSRFEGDGKLLPPLDGNISCRSAFSHPFAERRFTHVVGNPPWLRLKRRGTRRNVRPDVGRPRPAKPMEDDPALAEFLGGLRDETPVLHGRLSDAFVWLVAGHLAMTDAVIGLVLPTTSLSGRQSGGFATALATRLAVSSLANLSYLRYRLFPGAHAAATVVVARLRTPKPSDPVTVYRPRLSSLPVGRLGDVWALFESQTDLHTVRARDLRGDANGWFGPLILGTVDRRARDALRIVAREGDRTVAGFLRRSNLDIKRGGDESQTGFRFPTRQVGGKEVASANLIRLPDGPGPEVFDAYRILFSGNVLLLPRKFKGLRVLEEPHAFNSTYYGIFHSPDGSTGGGAAGPCPPAAGIDGLRNLKAFLESGVVRYFSAIFGATVLMDGARFEKGDLLSLPCPFEDMHHPCFRALSDAGDIDAAILDALGAGADLKRQVSEFGAFSEGYADAQLPFDAFHEVEADQFDVYVERLRRELATSFTRRRSPIVTVADRTGGLVHLEISLGRGEAGASRKVETGDGTFVASSVASFDRATAVATLRKSSGRFAWMSDQAVEDADAIVRQVTSGAP